MESLSPQVISAAKVPILNPNEFDLWKMRIEQYFLMTDYSLWEVILNGDSPAPTRIVDDAKTLMEAIEKRFRGNTETKKEDINLKFLRSLPSEWRTHTLIWRNKTGLEEQSLDDLINSLKIYKAEVKSSSSASTSTQNIAFVSSSNTDSTNEPVTAALSISVVCAKMHVSSLPNVDSLMRARRFLQRTGRNLGANGPTSIGFDMSKVECYNCHRKGHFAKECRSPKDTRRNDADEPQRRSVLVETTTSNALVSQCLESVEARLLVYQQNEYVFEEDIKLLKLEVQLRDNALVNLRKNLKKAEQERDDLKLKLEKFQTSSKNLTELLASQTNAKTGLGYNSQVFTRAMFDCDDYLSSRSDESFPPSPIYYRYQSGNGYHLSPTKPDQDLSLTTRPSAPIIEDWVSDSEDESETKAPQNVPSFVQPTEQVKYPRPSGNPQHALKDKGVIDSGCSRHMTGNMSYLSDFKELNGGYVAFGGNPKGSKISGKDDCSRFTWVFFLATKDETSLILKTFITCLENQLSLKVKVIRSDNGTEFKNNDLNQFCGMKGIKREFSVPRTLQQNGIAERKNKTLIEAARTMLADSLLPIPFWAEGVNTACYVQNKVLVTKPHNKTPYELLHGGTPSIGFMRPFGCPVTILNTLDSLGKFDRKVDEGFLVGYYNTDGDAAFDEKEHEFDAKKPESEVNVSPSKFEDFSDNSINEVNDVGTLVPTVRLISLNSTNTFSAVGPSNAAASPTHGKYSCIDASQLLDDPDMPELEDITYSNDEDDVGAEADFNNLETSITVSYIPTTRVHKDHPVTQIIGDPSLATQTRSMARVAKDQGGLSHVCLLSFTKEPKRVHQALKDPSWIEAMQEELLQIKMQKVWILVDLPRGKRAIGTKWVFRNKKDERVARIEAIRLFLAYASFMGFMVYQIDVKSVVLYGTIEEEVYVCQPSGFEDPDYLDKFYVDDIIFGSTNKDLCKYFKKLMKDTLQMSSMGELTFFLGLLVKQKKDGIFISHDKYVAEILKKFGLTDGKLASTPIDTEKPLLKDPDGEDVDVHTYRSMIGSLMYLTSSRPNIMFAVCACARFQVTPKASHLHAVKRIFRYLKGKPHLGLWYPKDSLFDLVAYSDSDYAGASLDRKSTTGGCQFLGCRLISWQCKKQTVVATSSTEAEYVAAASCCAQVLWIQNQLLDYGLIFTTVSTNVSAVWSDELFWTTVAVKKVNDVTRLQALVDKKKVVVTEATIRDALRLDDAEGVECLPNEKIFAELARMGYEKPSTKLSFYKAFFSSQWKFLIHTLLQCMSAKRTSWNEFSSLMASAVICLSSGRKFNFSKYIFDSLVRNVDSPTKFYMYPRFLQLMIRKQVGDLLTHTTKYTFPALTQKVSANMRRVAKGFSGVKTPLFEGMVVAHEVGEGVADEVYDEGVPAAGVGTEWIVSAANDERIDTSDDTVMDDVSNQGRMIADMDVDADVVLEEAKDVADDAKDDQDADVQVNADIQGRTAESQAKIYKIDLDHANKVLSMQEEKSEPAELQEVVDIVTTAKIITEVITAASTTITAADVPVPAPALTAAPSRRRKGLVIRDPEESTTTFTNIHSKAKSKDNGKGILVEEPKPLKKQSQIEQDEKYAKELEADLNRTIDWMKLLTIKEEYDDVYKECCWFQDDYFKGISYDDIRPVFEKHFDLNVAFLQKTKEQIDEEESRALKRINETPTEKATKRQKLEEEVEELKRHLQIVPNENDDVYTEATPLARKVPVVDYEIYNQNNKPYYKIKRADGTHQLYISFLSLLRNFDREDLKVLWSLVKERFATTKPKNFFDDFLLMTLGAMFEKPDIHTQIWKNQRSVHGQAKVKSWKLLESCGV
nr:hypothetical protein [Tanacetum cinerariifolium]